MGDKKSCLFCGKSVDGTFEYCPHCGYEFGDSDDYLPPRAEEAAAAAAAASGSAPCAEEDGNYLVRLRTLQEILADMEKELDLIIRTSSKDP
jgi:hypothetical protein